MRKRFYVRYVDDILIIYYASRIRITKFDINVVFGSLRRVLFESLRQYIEDDDSSILELLVPLKLGSQITTVVSASVINPIATPHAGNASTTLWQ